MMDLFAIAIVIVPLILNTFMLISLQRKSDERAAFIRQKATFTTFIFINGYIFYYVIQMFGDYWGGMTELYSDLNPIILLGYISIFYFFSLLYYTRKSGG